MEEMRDLVNDSLNLTKFFEAIMNYAQSLPPSNDFIVFLNNYFKVTTKSPNIASASIVSPKIVSPNIETVSPKINGDCNLKPKVETFNNCNDELALPDVESGRHKIQLSFVYSTRKFFVHLKYAELDDFISKMSDFYHNADLNLITVNSPDIIVNKHYALLNVDEQLYYRIRIVQIINDTTVKVIYIDYGETAEVLKDNIFKLVAQFKKMPIFAVECFFNDQWTSNYQNLDTALWNFMDTSNFPYDNLEANFKGKIDDRFIITQLYFDRDGSQHEFTKFPFNFNTEFFANIHFNFKTFISNLNYKQSVVENAYQKYSAYYPKCNLKQIDGTMMKVFDISTFLIKTNLLDNFISNFSFFYNSFDNVINCKVNDLIVIYYQNYYLRVFVLDKNDSGFELFAIDLGGTINLEEIVAYKLIEIFSPEIFPPFTILCGMNGLVPANGKNTWNLMATAQFKKLTTCDSFILKPVSSWENGKFPVDINANGIDVSQKLKALRIAKEK